MAGAVSIGRPRMRRSTAVPLIVVLAAACSGAAGAPRTLTFGAYTTPREVYGREILPAFAAWWRDSTGQEVRFEESYLGSSAQARAIVAGFEADVAALSLEPDIETIARAGLIRHDWKRGPGAGVVTHSIVVIGVRAGNPKNIRDWSDLARPGVQVLTPNPSTSGGAMWNVAAVWGAALRGAAGTPGGAGDTTAATTLLTRILRNVPIMDKGARESMLTFERGVGDAIITYENEALVARMAGQAIDYVVPRATILIENPIAVVDVFAERHGNRDLAQAFVRFVMRSEMQRKFHGYGLRPGPGAPADTAHVWPPVADLFTVRDLAGWPALTAALFAPGARFERAVTAAAGR